MADEAVVDTGTVVDAQATQDVAATPDATGAKAEARTFTQAELDTIVKERIERERRKSDDAVKKAADAAEAKRLAEAGEYKTIAEKLQAELDAERNRAKALELSALKRAAAEKVGLPAALADRLVGDDADALEQDARAVFAALPKPAAPNINAASGGGNGAQLVGGVTEEQLREQATRLGVNPEYYRKQFLRS
jgi:hypothetical protein